jgi:hypothetical protein
MTYAADSLVQKLCPLIDIVCIEAITEKVRTLVGSCHSIFNKIPEDASCLPLYEEVDITKLKPYEDQRVTHHCNTYQSIPNSEPPCGSCSCY